MDHRREMERMATLRAARAQEAKESATHELAEALKTEEMIGRRWCELVGRQTLMWELLEIRAQLRSAKADTDGRHRALREREEILAVAMEELLTAAKAKEVLLRLKDRAFEEFAARMRRTEDLQLDEASLRPFAVPREASGEGDTSSEVP